MLNICPKESWENGRVHINNFKTTHSTLRFCNVSVQAASSQILYTHKSHQFTFLPSAALLGTHFLYVQIFLLAFFNVIGENFHCFNVLLLSSYKVEYLSNTYWPFMYLTPFLLIFVTDILFLFLYLTLSLA